MSCGYLGIVFQNETDFCFSRAITLHVTLKLVPMLQEMRKGLELYGLGDLMTKHPEICQSLFVPGTETEVSIYSAMRKYSFSSRFVMLLPYVKLFSSFLQWVTGQGHIPILSQEKKLFKITVQFNQNCDVKYSEHRICYPTVAACNNTIILPVKHMVEFL
uniref:Uncharacterized protein n=1 Tax=Sinocyclocheilus anshuiensis TaxID=1608454 RepID=A0A671N301_9TELE